MVMCENLNRSVFEIDLPVWQQQSYNVQSNWNYLSSHINVWNSIGCYNHV